MAKVFAVLASSIGYEFIEKNPTPVPPGIVKTSNTAVNLSPLYTGALPEPGFLMSCEIPYEVSV